MTGGGAVKDCGCHVNEASGVSVKDSGFEVKFAREGWEVTVAGGGTVKGCDWEVTVAGGGTVKGCDWEVTVAGEGTVKGCDWEVNVEGGGTVKGCV